MTARRRTPAEMAQDRLAKADERLTDLRARRDALRAEGARIDAAIQDAKQMRDYHAAHPLLKGDPEPDLDEPALCPECTAGKHRNCAEDALAADDRIVPCECTHEEQDS